MNIKHLILISLILVPISFVAQKSSKFSKQEIKLIIKRQEDSIKKVQKNTLFKQKAPDFEAETITGEKVLLSELNGKVIVLNFWFTTCKPCVKEIPKLNREFSNFKNNNFVFLSLCTDRKEKLEEFIKKTSLSHDFKVIANAETIARKYKVFAFPCNMVISKDGIVKYINTGYSPNSVVVLKRKVVKELK